MRLYHFGKGNQPGAGGIAADGNSPVGFSGAGLIEQDRPEIIRFQDVEEQRNAEFHRHQDVGLARGFQHFEAHLREDRIEDFSPRLNLLQDVLVQDGGMVFDEGIHIGSQRRKSQLAGADPVLVDS